MTTRLTALPCDADPGDTTKRRTSCTIYAHINPATSITATKRANAPDAGLVQVTIADLADDSSGLSMVLFLDDEGVARLVEALRAVYPKAGG